MYALVKNKALIAIFKVASKDNYQQFRNQNVSATCSCSSLIPLPPFSGPYFIWIASSYCMHGSNCFTLINNNKRHRFWGIWNLCPCDMVYTYNQSFSHHGDQNELLIWGKSLPENTFHWQEDWIILPE